MGAPLGFAVHNILLGTFQQWGMWGAQWAADVAVL